MSSVGVDARSGRLRRRRCGSIQSVSISGRPGCAARKTNESVGRKARAPSVAAVRSAGGTDRRPRGTASGTPTSASRRPSCRAGRHARRPARAASRTPTAISASAWSSRKYASLPRKRVFQPRKPKPTLGHEVGEVVLREVDVVVGGDERRGGRRLAGGRVVQALAGVPARAGAPDDGRGERRRTPGRSSRGDDPSTDGDGLLLGRLFGDGEQARERPRGRG